MNRTWIAMLTVMMGLATFSPGTSAEQETIELQSDRQYDVYTVVPGDTMWDIAGKKLSSPTLWKEIIAPKKITLADPDHLKPGQTLLLPKTQNGATAINEEQPAQEQAVRVSVIGVEDFRNTGGGASHQWLSPGLADMITADLAKIPSIRVRDRDGHISVTKKQKDRKKAPEAAPQTAIGDADHLITGSYQLSDQKLSINAELVRQDTKTAVASAEVSGDLSRIFELERLLLLKLLASAVEIPDNARADLFAGEKTTTEVLTQISQGRQLAAEGKLQEARERFRRALEMDPKYRTTISYLKDTVTSKETLAIMPFKNATGKSDLNWFGTGISEALTTDLRKLTKTTIVERAQIDRALEALKTRSPGFGVDDKGAQNIGKMVGAGVIAVGAYQIVQDKIRIDVRLVDVVSSVVLLTDSVTGPSSALFEVEAKLAERIASALHVRTTPEQLQAMLAEKPGLDAYKQQIQSQTKSAPVFVEQATGARGIQAVAVSDFGNSAKDREYDWLKSAIPGALTTDLKAKTVLNLVERVQVDSALEELKLASIGLISADQAPQFGRMVGADAVLTGSYQIQGESLRIDAKLIRVESGEVVSEGSASGSIHEVFDLEKQLANDIIMNLGEAVLKKKKNKSILADLEDDSENGNLARRAYKFELAAGQQDKFKFLLKKQKDRTDNETLTNMTAWLQSIRSLSSAEEKTFRGSLVREGDSAPYRGFLITREMINRLQFVKEERDLCIEVVLEKGGK